MIVSTHTDPYAPPGPDGQPAQVKRYGIGIASGRRSFGRRPDGSEETNAEGETGADTVTAVMLDTGGAEVFDVAAIEVLKTS